MLTKVTPEAAKAMFRLSGQAEWQAVAKMLDDELAATYKHLVLSPDEAKLRQLQGRAQFIQEFQAAVRDARSNLEKLGGSSL